MNGSFTEKLDRERMAQDLGFRSYKHYLASDMWKDIKRRAVELKGCECSTCKRPHEAVHHQFYDINTMKGRDLTYLWPLCDKCHQIVHKDRRGRFLDCFKSSSKLLQMVHRKKNPHTSKRPGKRKKKKHKPRQRMWKPKPNFLGIVPDDNESHAIPIEANQQLAELNKAFYSK